MVARTVALLLALALAAHAGTPAGEEDLALEPIQDLLRDEPDDAHEPEPAHQPPTDEELRQLANLENHANGGDASAQYQVGKRYATGKGAPHDPVKARSWYERAARNEILEAANSLAILLANGARGVPRDPTRAREWLRRAARGKNALALYNLGQQHRTGELFERDDARAFRYFKEAAELGLPAARTNVGTMYMEGTGVAANPEEAVRSWQQAADADDPRAMYFLGVAYLKGTPATPKDPAKAKMYLDRAKNRDHPGARKLLAESGL